MTTFGVEISFESLLASTTVASMATVITASAPSLADDQELLRALTEIEALSEEEAERRLDGID